MELNSIMPSALSFSLWRGWYSCMCVTGKEIAISLWAAEKPPFTYP